MAERRAMCRVQAALNAGTIKDVFKTQRCFKANCKRLHCTYYHDESDQLPLIGYKAQYCIAHKVRPPPLWLSHVLGIACQMYSESMGMCMYAGDWPVSIWH